MTLAVIVLTWIMSFMAVTPERGNVPLRMQAPQGGAHVVMADPLRLGVRVPVGDARFELRLRLPETLPRDGLVLFSDHVHVVAMRFTDLASGRSALASSYHPVGKEAGGATPFYVFPLAGQPGEVLRLAVQADSQINQTMVLRVLPTRAFQQIERRVAMGQAIRYGALLAMVTLLLALHLSTREPASLAYVWAGLVSLVSLLQLDSYLYLLPGAGWLGELGVSLFLAVRILVVVALIHLFLWTGQADAPPPRLRRRVNGFCLLLLALAILQGLRWMPAWLIGPLGWLYMLGSLLLLWLGWRAVRNRMPLARSIFVLLLGSVLGVFLADLYDMGMFRGGWWLNSAGIGLLIVWLGVIGVGLIRRTEHYRHQLQEAAARQHALQQAAETDLLTGLANRAAADARMREWSRLGQPWSAMFIDIDHFKSINDTHGHAAGDHVLREVARTLQGAVREGDCVARYGGEEFVLLTPAPGGEEVPRLAERIRGRVAALALEWDGRRLPVTVSIGVAAPACADETPAARLARADAAMYAAKRQGRNRVASTPSAADCLPQA